MRALVAALLIAGAPSLAVAQEPAAAPVPTTPASQIVPLPPVGPVSGFVVDARGVLAKFGQRPETATALGVNPKDMPGPGLGVSAGAHVYPLRLGRMAIGIGGEVVMARRARQPLTSSGEPDGPQLTSRMFTFSPQLSFNFGNRNGWSYVSGGLGTGSFETWPAEEVNPDRRVRVINYGGGARWFLNAHLAFTMDLRFYAVSPALADTTFPDERPRARLMMLSAGFSVR